MTEEQKTIKCPKCGTENSSNDKFCQECGNSLIIPPKSQTNVNKFKSPIVYPYILEIIYFIFCSLAAWLVCNIQIWDKVIPPEHTAETINNAETMFQQLYYLGDNTNIYFVRVFYIIAILGGLLVALAIWSVFKFNRIERRIIETQEMINKKG